MPTTCVLATTRRGRIAARLLFALGLVLLGCGGPDELSELSPDEIDDGPPADDTADDEATLDSPPSLVAAVDGDEVSMARGGYCWTDTAGEQTCGDPFGVVTASDELTLRRGDTVRLTLDPDIDVTGVDGNLFEPASEAEERGRLLVWPEVRSVERLDADAWPQVVIDVPPGRYILEVRLSFDQDGVSYGALLEVE